MTQKIFSISFTPTSNHEIYVDILENIAFTVSLDDDTNEIEAICADEKVSELQTAIKTASEALSEP